MRFYDWESLMEFYKKYVTKTSIVLEIGASYVERTRELSQWCRNLIGVELMPERKPNDFDNIKYVIGDWQNLSEFIELNEVDIAVSSHVIEHVVDDLKAINELYIVLKSGGVAILTTPNRKRLTRVIIEMFTGERKFPFWEHQREYTENDLYNLLKKSNFVRFEIFPVAIGLRWAGLYLYVKSVPKCFRRFANYWTICLYKD